MITIFQYNTTQIRAIVDPDASSGETAGIMGTHVLKLTFKSTVYIDFQVGDYATAFGTLFRLNVDAEFNKIANRDYDFTLTMEGPVCELRRAQYLTLNANNRFTEGKFPLRNKPLGFCKLIIANMNRLFPGLGWELGNVLDADFQTLEFDGENCLKALNKLADAFKTEFLIEGRKIHFAKRQLSSGIALEYGSGKPLYGIGRKNQGTADIITRLYVYGSSKNIGTNYRGGAPRLRMANSLFLERNISASGGYEATVVFDGTNGLPEIFPHRTGIVSAVTSPFIFTDNSIDFDINSYLLPVKAKVTFNTGLLAGITFEIHEFNYATKTFTINANISDSTVNMPSDDFKPAIGDEYVVIDIDQPLEYYEAAEDELAIAGAKYLADNGPNKVSFPVLCNPFYFKANSNKIKLGNTVHLLSNEMGIDRVIRIYNYTRNYRNQNLYTIELSDNVTSQPIVLKLLTP